MPRSHQQSGRLAIDHPNAFLGPYSHITNFHQTSGVASWLTERFLQSLRPIASTFGKRYAGDAAVGPVNFGGSHQSAGPARPQKPRQRRRRELVSMDAEHPRETVKTTPPEGTGALKEGCFYASIFDFSLEEVYSHHHMLWTKELGVLRTQELCTQLVRLTNDR